MPDYVMWIIVAVLIVLIIVFFVFQSRKSKKKQQEAEDLMNAVKPGNKVKTIGGVCGIVVEVDAEENTFVLETGSEQSGKSYMKFDKQAIYQTDAVVEKPAEGDKASKEEKEEKGESSSEEPFEAEQAAAEKSGESAAEGDVPAAEEEKPKKHGRKK